MPSPRWRPSEAAASRSGAGARRDEIELAVQRQWRGLQARRRDAAVREVHAPASGRRQQLLRHRARTLHRASADATRGRSGERAQRRRGAGRAFMLTWPVAPAEAVNDRSRTSGLPPRIPGAGGRGRSAPRGGRRREPARRRLSRSTRVGDGRAGARLARLASTCGLIVLDVMLPERRRLHRLPHDCAQQGNNTPVLFLTARGDPADRVRGLEAGGDDYLAKPFHLQEFLLRVRAILRRWDWYRQRLGDRRPRAVLQLRRQRSGFPRLPRALLERRGAGADREGSDDPQGAGRARRARSSRARTCWRRCGAMTCFPPPARSTISSCGCASASSATRPIRSTSSRCGASATAS